ncbi:UNVERIFIED_CONTAM: hypothetical protein HDU68_009625, partial [Siphonaria sp. JEL0065]
MASFDTEIWTVGLHKNKADSEATPVCGQLPGMATPTAKRSPSFANRKKSVKESGIVYRIFHHGQTHAPEVPQSLARSKRYDSDGSDATSDSEYSSDADSNANVDSGASSPRSNSSASFAKTSLPRLASAANF